MGRSEVEAELIGLDKNKKRETISKRDNTQNIKTTKFYKGFEMEIRFQSCFCIEDIFLSSQQLVFFLVK